MPSSQIIGSEMASVAALVLIIVGAVSCFFGYRIFKFILGLLGFFIGGALAGSLGYALSDGKELVAIISGLVGGLIVASLFVFLFFVGVFCLGAGLGVLLGGVLSAAAQSDPHPVLLVVLAVLGGVAALFLQKLIIVAATGFGGAFYIVTSILYFAKGYDPITVLEDPGILGGTLYIGLLCWVLLGIAGVIVQYFITAGKARKSSKYPPRQSPPIFGVADPSAESGRTKGRADPPDRLFG